MALPVASARRRHRRPWSRASAAVLLPVVLLVLLLVVGGALLAAGGVAWTGGSAPVRGEWSRLAPPAGARPAAARTERSRQARPPRARPAVEVLRAWDVARAAAYATGSVTALRQLYVGGAGAADVRLLRSYLRRGLRVEGMRMQLLDVTVLAHRPGHWLLRVTDRLVGGEAVGYAGRVALPRDRASTRTVRLARQADGRWRVVAVRD